MAASAAEAVASVALKAAESTAVAAATGFLAGLAGPDSAGDSTAACSSPSSAPPFDHDSSLESDLHGRYDGSASRPWSLAGLDVESA